MVASTWTFVRSRWTRVTFTRSLGERDAFGPRRPIPRVPTWRRVAWKRSRRCASTRYRGRLEAHRLHSCDGKDSRLDRVLPSPSLGDVPAVLVDVAYTERRTIL